MTIASVVFLLWAGGVIQQLLIGAFLVPDHAHREMADDWAEPFRRFPLWAVILIWASLWPITLFHAIVSDDDDEDVL